MVKLPQPKLTKVEVPEWGGSIYLRKMSGTERSRWELEQYRLGKVEDKVVGMTKEGDEILADKDVYAMMDNMYARLLSRVICDEKGKTLFTFEELGDQDYDVLQRLYELAAPLNGLGAEAAAEIKKK